MKIAVNLIGSLIVALVLIGIPVMTTTAFCCGWPGIIKYGGVILSAIEAIGLWNYIIERTD